MLLQGKVCLITGCSRGIGRQMVVRFAEEGATVYANARTYGCIDDFCQALSEKHNTTIIPLYFDVTDESAAKEAIMTIKKQSGRLDVLVNNAGIMQDALIGMINKDLMQKIFDVNVFAPMNMMQLACKIMVRQKSGSIINLSSIVGVEGNPGQLVYSSSKGAVISMTKTAAKELAPNNIRVNAVAPGMIDTDMFRSIGEEKMQNHLSHIKMGRFGLPNDIANAAVFLASDYSNYITGQVLGVDGGALV